MATGSPQGAVPSDGPGHEGTVDPARSGWDEAWLPAWLAAADDLEGPPTDSGPVPPADDPPADDDPASPSATDEPAAGDAADDTAADDDVVDVAREDAPSAAPTDVGEDLPEPPRAAVAGPVVAPERGRLTWRTAVAPRAADADLHALSSLGGGAPLAADDRPGQPDVRGGFADPRATAVVPYLEAPAGPDHVAAGHADLRHADADDTADAQDRAGDDDTADSDDMDGAAALGGRAVRPRRRARVLVPLLLLAVGAGIAAYPSGDTSGREAPAAAAAVRQDTASTAPTTRAGGATGQVTPPSTTVPVAPSTTPPAPEVALPAPVGAPAAAPLGSVPTAGRERTATSARLAAPAARAATAPRTPSPAPAPAAPPAPVAPVAVAPVPVAPAPAPAPIVVSPDSPPPRSPFPRPPVPRPPSGPVVTTPPVVVEQPVVAPEAPKPPVTPDPPAEVPDTPQPPVDPQPPVGPPVGPVDPPEDPDTPVEPPPGDRTTTSAGRSS